jgi:hypothetical protein
MSVHCRCWFGYYFGVDIQDQGRKRVQIMSGHANQPVAEWWQPWQRGPSQQQHWVGQYPGRRGRYQCHLHNDHSEAEVDSYRLRVHPEAKESNHLLQGRRKLEAINVFVLSSTLDVYHLFACHRMDC